MEQEQANGTAATSDGDQLFAEVDLLSPAQTYAPSDRPEEELKLEFFDQKAVVTEGGGGGGSAVASSKDSDSHNSQSFATLSPPISPEKPHAHERSDDVDSALLQSLEDSTSSSDVPKSKLEPRRLDPPSPVGVGQDRPPSLDSYIAAGIQRSAGRGGGGGGVEQVSQDMDLKVAVTDRAKHGIKSDTYITYKIVTDTTRPSHLFATSHYETWRRYRDFEWLRLQIEKHHPTLIVPPLPGKQLSRYFDQMSDEFLSERQKALGNFLYRLTAHPYFSFSSTLRVFLTANPEELSRQMTETSSGYKLLGVMTSSMKQATTSLMLKNVDPEFAKEAKYFTELGDKLSVMEKVSTRIHSDRGELSVAEDDFSLSLFHWASLEPQVTQPLQKIASCVDHCNAAQRKLNDANALSLLMTLKEYQLYCASAVSAIRRRDMLQLECDRASDDRVKKKKTHDQAVTSGKVEKLVKLADGLEKVGVAAEHALDNMSQANEQLRVDIEKWKEAKNRDISRLMSTVSSDHVHYHQTCFSEWETVLRILKNIKPEPPLLSSKASAQASPGLPLPQEDSSQNLLSQDEKPSPFTTPGGGDDDRSHDTEDRSHDTEDRSHDTEDTTQPGVFGGDTVPGKEAGYTGLFGEEDNGLFGGAVGDDGMTDKHERLE